MSKNNIKSIIIRYLKAHGEVVIGPNHSVEAQGKLISYEAGAPAHSNATVSLSITNINLVRRNWVSKQGYAFSKFVLGEIMTDYETPKGLSYFIAAIKDKHSMYEILNQVMIGYNASPEEVITILSGKYRKPTLYSFLRDVSPRITEKAVSLLLTKAAAQLPRESLCNIVSEFNNHITNTPTTKE